MLLFGSNNQSVGSRSIIKRLVAAFVLYWLPVIVFVSVAKEIWERDAIGLDSAFLGAIHRIATPGLDRIFLHITNLGGFTAILAATSLIFGLLIARHRRRDAAFLAVGVGGAMIINLVLKIIFQRPRPAAWHRIVVESGYSFPSGHAMMSSALALSIIFLVWGTRWRWAALLIGGLYIGLIGLSRMYLGVHFPTDIIAGWCVSLLWIVIVSDILGLRPYLIRNPTTPAK